MATLIVSSTATGGGTGSEANPYTVDEARLFQVAGDVIQMRSGNYAIEYDNSDGLGGNGTARAPIIWRPHDTDPPVIQARWRPEGHGYLTFEGLEWNTPNGEAWLYGGPSDAGTNHITIDSCTFTTQARGSQSLGIHFASAPFLTIRDCTFSDWLTTDAVHLVGCHRLLFAANDFSVARAGRSLVNLTDCSRGVIHGNYLRNSLDRALQAYGGSDMVLQWNLVVDTDWDRTETHPFTGTPDQAERGASEALRMMCRRGIARYNLILRAQPGKNGSTESAWTLDFFGESRDAQFSRFYHNTLFEAIDRSLFGANVEAGVSFDDLDIRWINNVLANGDEYAFRLNNSTELSWRTYKVLSNVIADSEKTATIFLSEAAPSELTVTEAETDHPEVFQSNETGDPTFTDSTIGSSIEASPSSYSIADLPSIFSAMTLTAASASGKGTAAAIATVTVDGTSVTTVDVSDAYVFTNGWGLVEADQVIIGTNPTVGVVAVISSTQIEVDTPVTVTAGDEIRHDVILTATDGEDKGIPQSAPPTATVPTLGTDDETPEENEDAILALPPSGDDTIEPTASNITFFPNANPTLQKVSAVLNIAGVSESAPILSGLSARIQLDLNPGERLLSWRIYNKTFENQLLVDDEENPTATIVFGSDTASGPNGVRNYLEIITTSGPTVRQFWVKDLPAFGALYVNNVESQAGELVIVTPSDEALTIGLNILPTFSDEFFQLGEYSGNRWANTLRHFGGALTGEVFFGSPPSLIISERYIADVNGWYWDNPAVGIYPITVRLRAAIRSPQFVDISGSIQIQN